MDVVASCVAELVDGRYRVRATLGSGAMGVVSLAEDIWLGRKVALKFVRPARATDAFSVDVFRKEAQILARMRHENVVQVYAFGPHDGAHYLAMEYVEGETLEDSLRRRTMSPERAIAIVRQVAAGLAAVHARGLVHQDVKPANIIIEKGTGRPVLIDFGLARGATTEPSELAEGTPSYMAPEQARGLEVTPRCDVYALACTAFELLAGRPVFEGSSARTLLAAHVTRTPPRLSARRRDLAHFDLVFARALAKDPRDRHGSVLAFVDDLDAAVHRGRREALTARSSERDVRVAVLERDEALRRQIVRLADRTLRAAGDVPAIDCAGSAKELAALCEERRPEIVIVDAESTDDAVAEVLAMIVPHVRPEVLVLTKRFDKTMPAPPIPVCELPKPINPHVLASVLSRLAAALVRERAGGD